MPCPSVDGSADVRARGSVVEAAVVVISGVVEVVVSVPPLSDGDVGGVGEGELPVEEVAVVGGVVEASAVEGVVSVGVPWPVLVSGHASSDDVGFRLSVEGFHFDVVDVDSVGFVGDDVEFEESAFVHIAFGGYFDRFGAALASEEECVALERFVFGSVVFRGSDPGASGDGGVSADFGGPSAAFVADFDGDSAGVVRDFEEIDGAGDAVVVVFGIVSAGRPCGDADSAFKGGAEGDGRVSAFDPVVQLGSVAPFSAESFGGVSVIVVVAGVRSEGGGDCGRRPESQESGRRCSCRISGHGDCRSRSHCGSLLSLFARSSLVLSMFPAHFRRCCSCRSFGGSAPRLTTFLRTLSVSF